MTSNAAFESDKGIGLAILLGVLAVAGALVMLASPGTETAAWGFAAAVIFGCLLVVAIHVYPPGNR